MRRSELLREHLETGKVALGVNHTLRDFQTQRNKDLDLVIAQPATQSDAGTKRRFAEMAVSWGLQLTSQDTDALKTLPPALEAPVGSVLVAVERKRP